MKMTMGFTIKSNDCPAGVHKAVFNGCERTTHVEYGDGLKFEFEVVDGPHKGVRACRYTSADPTPRNAAGRLMADLAGQKPTNNLSVDVDEFVGHQYLIVVREGESGRTRVENADPIQDTPF
jgi:hypothetical protein